MTLIQSSLKKNEEYAYNNLLNYRKKVKSKFQVKDFIRVADLKKNFSDGDTTFWSYTLYKNTEIGNDTIPSYKIDHSQGRYNEALLERTEITLKENNSVMTTLNLS